MHQLPHPNVRPSNLVEGKKVSGRESHGGVSSNVVMMPGHFARNTIFTYAEMDTRGHSQFSNTRLKSRLGPTLLLCQMQRDSCLDHLHKIQ